MPLSTLWRVDRTVEPDGNSPVAEQILQDWDHDPRSARFFRSSANFVYRFRGEGQPYFLRFADDGERTSGGIGAEMDLLRWLQGEGISVSTPVPSRRGNLVETVPTDWGVFHAVVFPALPGDHWEFDDLDASGFHRWGAALGALHAALRRYEGEARSVRGTWEDQLEAAWSTLQSRGPIVQQEGEKVRSLLRALPRDREVFGLIHGDVELDNLVWSDGVAGILDFDECVGSWYVADIALALRDLFAEGVDLAHPSFQAFMRGYGAHSPVDGEMLRHIPTFLRLGSVLTYARLVRAVDLPPDGAYPEWLTALQRKLENWTTAYERSLESRALEGVSDI